MSGLLETDSLLRPRPVESPQISRPGVQNRRCSPSKSILYFTGMTVSLGAIGVGIYNVAVDPSPVMAAIAKYSLPVLGVCLVTSIAKNMGDLFKQKDVIVLGFPLDGESSENGIIIERRTILRLIEQVARNNKITIPNPPVNKTGASLNELINERLDLINQALAKAGVMWGSYITLNQSLDRMLAEYQIPSADLNQHPIEQQVAMKLQRLEQAIPQDGD